MIGVVETQFAYTLSDHHAGFRGLMDGAEAFLAAGSVPAKMAAHIMIALDEIVSNIFHHGARDGERLVDVTLRIEADRVSAQIIDDGLAFDPLQSADPDISLSSEARPIGGLGIFLVRRIMDDVRYDLDHGKNRLRFYKLFALEQPDSASSAH